MNLALELIPLERREGARSALAATFGSSPVSEPQPLHGGASAARIYRVDHEARAYVLRLDHIPGASGNPHRGYACMRAAADAGIAPPLRYADPETGVAIMDFIETRPRSEYPGGAAGFVRELGSLVASLQATPVFPPVADFAVLVDHVFTRLRKELFAPGLLAAHHEGFERIRSVYPWNSAGTVSSHNDLNPMNVLFDGARLWLVDWEGAFRNEPLADVANAAVNFDATPDLDDALLKSWLGCAPERELHARYVLMQQVCRLYYAGVILRSSIGRQPQETSLDALTREQLVAASRAGTWVPGAPGSMHVLGKSYLATFLRELHSARFESALEIVASG
jgi:aminoglycoside phosphotransferase (APT) family kinase protein